MYCDEFAQPILDGSMNEGLTVSIMLRRADAAESYTSATVPNVVAG
jgi:type IV secretory pathway ATPase VirB11/archaellum biosynthesis ATPase